MNSLFDRICDVVFILKDGSQILCKVTLNENILQKFGYAMSDDFIDIMTGRIIPDELFDNKFQVLPEDTVVLSELDKMFLDGGKISWKLLN